MCMTMWPSTCHNWQSIASLPVARRQCMLVRLGQCTCELKLAIVVLVYTHYILCMCNKYM